MDKDSFNEFCFIVTKITIIYKELFIFFECQNSEFLGTKPCIHIKYKNNNKINRSFCDYHERNLLHGNFTLKIT